MTASTFAKIISCVCFGLSSEIPASLMREGIEMFLKSEILESLARAQGLTAVDPDFADSILREIAATPTAQKMAKTMKGDD